MGNASKHLLAILFVGSLMIPGFVIADQFDEFRKYIDEYQKFTFEEREAAIAELGSIQTEDLEKHYLLGMLNFIQGFQKMLIEASARSVKPKPQEMLQIQGIRNYFRMAEKNYDIVEARSQGYKYIYCKYTELYRYSFNENGLRKITRKLGKIYLNQQAGQCKNLLEDVAQHFAAIGYARLSKAIYEEAVAEWKSHPKYMLEALGDIEKALKNDEKAAHWWSRCMAEAERDDRKDRCAAKIGG